VGVQDGALHQVADLARFAEVRAVRIAEELALRRLGAQADGEGSHAPARTDDLAHDQTLARSRRSPGEDVLAGAQGEEDAVDERVAADDLGLEDLDQLGDAVHAREQVFSANLSGLAIETDAVEDMSHATLLSLGKNEPISRGIARVTMTGDFARES